MPTIVHAILLPRDSKATPLALEWDTDAGHALGPDAPRAEAIVAACEALGSAELAHPPNSAVRVADPRHNTGELVACFDRDFILPSAALELLPKVDDGGPCDVDLDY